MTRIVTKFSRALEFYTLFLAKNRSSERQITTGLLLMPVCLILVVLTACSGNNSAKQYRESGTSLDVLSGESFATVDLREVLDPNGHTRTLYGKKGWEQLSDEERFNEALEAFYNEYPPDTLTLRRNRTQERLLTASDASCSAFLDFLISDQESRKGLMGSMVESGKTAAKIVSGINPVAAAGNVASFMTEEDKDRLDSAEFASLTIQVIIEGIKKRRHRHLLSIAEKRSNASIKEYPVETAIRDALNYHRQCNIVSGMSEARNSLINSNKPMK